MEKEYSEKEIRRLLERFMSGETTIEEEDRLGDYFRTAHDIPAEWQDYMLMFGYFDSGMDIPAVAEPTGCEIIAAETAVAEPAGCETIAAETAVAEPAECETIAAETTVAEPTGCEIIAAETAVAEPAGCETIAAEVPSSGKRLLIVVRQYAAVAAAILLLVGMAVVMTYDNGLGQTSRRYVNRPALVAEQKNGQKNEQKNGQKSGQKNEQKNGQKTERDAKHNEDLKAERTKEQTSPQIVAQSGSQTVPQTEVVRRDSPQTEPALHVQRPVPMNKTAEERDCREEYEEIEREVINQYVIAEYNARRENGQCCILVENVDGYYELEDCASDIILM